MPIYTKTGDDGTTQLLTGERIAKNDARIIAVGYLDEATSHLGKMRSLIKEQRIREILEKIQSLFISIMGVVAASHQVTEGITEEDVSILEKLIDYYSLKVEPFKAFILPGATPLTAEIHIARTVVRRAETALSSCDVTPIIKRYINRLSDYLYILARYLETEQEQELHLEQELYLEQENKITLDLANELINKVRAYAETKKCRVVIGVVSPEGRPISVQVMEEAFIISYDLALKKAFTSVALKMPNHELKTLTAKGAAFEGLENMLEEKIVTLGGGYPLYRGETLVGGIGVSGGSADEDIALAAYGAKILQEGYHERRSYKRPTH